MRRRLVVELPSGASDPNVVLRGYGSADLIRELGGRATWSRSRRGWLSQRHRADDLVALAEHRGYAVRVVDGAR